MVLMERRVDRVLLESRDPVEFQDPRDPREPRARVYVVCRSTLNTVACGIRSRRQSDRDQDQTESIF